jgi:hypothetical protein
MDVGFELRAVPGLIRQGDLLLVPVSGFPDGVRRARSGRLVLAEGEATGHAHVRPAASVARAPPQASCSSHAASAPATRPR